PLTWSEGVPAEDIRARNRFKRARRDAVVLVFLDCLTKEGCHSQTLILKTQPDTHDSTYLKTISYLVIPVFSQFGAAELRKIPESLYT
ncbi:MAG: hypothetical protein D6743_02620, partial [Calditrichaeota bacterium]